VNTPELNIITTDDGSHSIFNSALNEHYHSTHGAIKESQHVFINAGLQKFLEQKPDQINILEVGLGTGLNVLLTLLYLQKNNIKIPVNYFALEPYPLQKEITEQLNYKTILNYDRAETILRSIHECATNTPIELNSTLSFTRIENKLQQEIFATKFDLVYFDAFAPQVQPELWEKEIFEKLYANMNPQTILTTYCAKGEVKRNLKAAGFIVEGLPGPPGKREITRAIKTLSQPLQGRGVNT